MLDISSADSIIILDELASAIRKALQASKIERCNALHHDLDAGDALIKAQAQVSAGWKRWLRENCFLSVRTALLYQQLARHRDEIEAEIERVGELSLRAAVRLIAKPGAPRATSKLKPDFLLAWQGSTDAELTASLEQIPLKDFLRVMPAAWRAELARRGVQHDDQSDNRDDRLAKILRTALSHIATADLPGTGKPAAQGQEHSALTALRTALTVLHAVERDLHDVQVVLRPRQSRETKRAA
jgi:hypothetical protein